jgi:Fe-S oxidoreductase
MRDIVFSRKVSIPPDDTLWSCTTCFTCKARCPKGLTPFDVVIKMREVVVEEGRVPPTIRDALENIFNHGNPWGRIRSKRSEWAEGLDVKPFSEEADLLYFVGCTPAYDPRCQEVAKALVQVFDAAGVRFGTLGNDESCCGSSVYGMGEKGLFDLLVEDNLKLFESRRVELIVSTSPHCYDVFKNRYGNIDFKVQHYTQFIADLIDSGRLILTRGIEKTITFHDPCFLGRRNNIYDEPRRILENIPRAKFIELDRSRERSLCCEGGGGRMWIDVLGERLAERRVRDAVDIGAEIIATACPFCLSTLEDAVLTTGYEDSIKVLDVVELVSQAL